MATPRKLLRTGMLVIASSALALAGCSSDKGEEAAVASSSAATSAAKSTEKSAAKTSAKAATAFTADNFHLHDGFVKAVPADAKMTAVFGVLENHTDVPAHLVSFSTNLDAKMYQIHEVVDGKMQEKAGGIVVEPNSKFVLKPGGDHLMIMGLNQAVDAGSKITVTLNFEDGASVVINDVPARTIGAGDENYEGDGSHAEHGDMKMGDKQEADSK